ncbi:hypothetical protein FD754_016464 [Muntiacus muntjak]|uniref:Protein-tyrosine sulfotransferase n=1 Tax=Muntiacus muntjak TaxID=9888 RepID=A0A5N3VQS4_MUNMU|nr:hypothetical protein FD754_016464 [Muntiacus muntjak]
MPVLEDLVIVGMDHLYGKALSLIFLGFLPWGDTMLLCAMLDAHPKMQCCKETHIISHVLAMSQAWSKSSQEKLQLDEAGMTDEVLDVAMQAFNLEVIAKHCKPVGILCNKVPSTLKFSIYLCASTYSRVTRNVTIASFNLGSYQDYLTKCSQAMEVMCALCMELILDLLATTWSSTVLCDKDLISMRTQVIKPVDLESLSKWTGHIPGDVSQDMVQIAPMLAQLGYDVLKGDCNQPANLKGYFQMNENSTFRSVVSDSLRPHELQHTRPPCPSPTPGVYSNSCPSSR